MKASPDNHDPRLDDHDPVWQLLARAPRPEPDGWFTARTLARCRQAERRLGKGLAPAWRVWRWALGGGIGVSLAALLLVTQTHPNPAGAEDQKNVQEAFEVVASAGPGSDSDSSSTSSTWQDSSY
ncbi:MAG: hypothetical protein LV481_02260 [Methylacidiphilales bacterium]|nr:hypothetical protein [Candidatus Methylacidiphilales bacterium]